MNKRNDYYSYYKKLIRMSFEETIEDTNDYNALYEGYPHLAESIRLERVKRRLRQERKYLEKRSARLRNKQKINAIGTRLIRENILKRLYGENKKEIMFKIRFKFETSKERVSLLKGMGHTILHKGYLGLRSFDRTIWRLLRRSLPPVIFDLGSLDMTEKGLAVRAWVLRREEK